MYTESDPYIINIVRVDVIKKVPLWAKDYINVGDEIIRLSHDEAIVVKSGSNLALGKSYSKYKEHRRYDGNTHHYH